MLLKNKATNSRMIHPERTGEMTYQYPNSGIFPVELTAIKAVAPPGGCSVLVYCINTIEKATAKGAESQMICGTN
jgi:hypothetical protein